MKKTCKFALVALFVLVTVLYNVAVAEEPMFYTLEEVIAQATEFDPEMTYELVNEDERVFFDVTWSWGMVGYVEMIQVDEEVYLCYSESVQRMMLCCAAGIDMEIENRLMNDFWW